MLIVEALAQSPALFIASCLVLGLIVGSFLNVVIYRVPIMLEREWRQQCAELAERDAQASGRAPAAADSAARQGEAANQETARARKHAAPQAAAPSHQTSAPPERFNLVTPRSACPSCKAPIKAYQNIPVLSYLFLKGRCAACGARIGVRYPFVEALTGLISALVAWKFGFGWVVAGALVLSWFLIALTFIDIDHQLLPDNMTLPLMWLGLLFSLWGPEAAGGPLPVDLRASVIGAIVGYMSLWSVFHVFRLLTGKEGMGYGDFKLLAALGAWLGWKMLLPIILVAAAVGAVVGIVILALKRQDRQTPIAFGPFLAASGWLMLMFGQEIVSRYMGLFGPRM